MYVCDLFRYKHVHVVCLSECGETCRAVCLPVVWGAVGTVFALGLCGGCKGGEIPLRWGGGGGGRELSGEPMACQTEKEREGGRDRGQR